jgi:hypothetical protein
MSAVRVPRRPRIWRIGASAALFAVSGVLYLARGLMDLGSPAYSNASTLFDYTAVVTTTLWMVALGAAIASLAITHTVGGVARIVAWVPAAALVIGGVANLLEDGFGMSALGFLFGVGGGLAVVGLVALGVCTLFDRRNERGIGVVLLLLGLSFTLPPFGRTAGVGILCLAMAYVLARQSDRSAEPGSAEEGAEEAQS